MPALVAGASDLDGARANQRSVAGDDRDLAAGDQSLQTLVEPGDHAVLVGVDGFEVNSLERRRNSELAGLPDRVGDLTRVPQGLGRDASAVQERAADLVLF